MIKRNLHSTPNSFVPGLEARQESLIFLLNEYFHPQVICSKQSGACSRIEDTLRFLSRNMMWEEQQMDLTDFPDALAHKRDHDRILNRLRDMNDSMVCSRYDNGLVAQHIKTWAKIHADEFDKPFSNFLNGWASTND